MPGVPHGKVSDKLTIVSKIYDGMKSDYWVYASPGVDPAVPAALMVWQDGQGLIGEYSRSRLFTVTENLVAQKLLPPIVHVMISPGQLDGRAMFRWQIHQPMDEAPLHWRACNLPSSAGKKNSTGWH